MTESVRTSGYAQAGTDTDSRSEPRNGWIAIACLLLVLYMFPPAILILGLTESHGGESESLLLNWFFALASTRTSALSELHHLILPVVTGMSVATLKRRESVAGWAMLASCLVGFLLILGAQVTLDLPKYAANLAGLGFTEAQREAGDTLLNLQRTNLLLYFAVLAGLNANSHGGNNVTHR